MARRGSGGIVGRSDVSVQMKTARYSLCNELSRLGSKKGVALTIYDTKHSCF